jgi:hypothetical protein
MSETSRFETPYLPSPNVHVRMGAGYEWVYSPLTRRSARMSESEVAVLRHPESALANQESFYKSTKAEIESMISPERLIEAIVREEKSASESRLLSWLAVPTHGRFHMLARGLPTYLSQFKQLDRNCKVLLADDSPDSDASQGKRLREKLHHEGEILWSERSSRRRLVQSLGERGDIPRRVLEFGFLGTGYDGVTTGANRNTILLLTAGEKMLSVDDDTICRLGTSPVIGSSKRLRFRDHLDSTEILVFASRRAAFDHVEACSANLVREHDRILGRSLSSLVAECAGGSGVELRGCCPHTIKCLHRGTGKVVATFNGIMGDSAAFSNAPLLTHPGAITGSKCLQSDDVIRALGRYREVVRHAPSVSICHGGLTMAGVVGLDNQKLLPPFMPVFRNEDGVFGLTTSLCITDAYNGHLPFAAIHDSETYPDQRQPMSESPDLLRDDLRVCDIVSCVLRLWQPDTKPTENELRIRSLGQHLGDVGRMGEEDFEELVRIIVANKRSEEVGFLEAMLAQVTNPPPLWTATMKRRRDWITQNSCRPDIHLPTDIDGSFSYRLLTLRQLICDFGELLYWWPSIVQRAASNGITANANIDAGTCLCI